MIEVKLSQGRDRYLGNSANRCFPSLSNNASFTRGMSRSSHYATEKLVNPTVYFGNFRFTAAEVAPLGVGTLKVALEYPDGVYTLADQCIAAGNNGVTFPAGITALTFRVTVPKRKKFRIRAYQVNPAGVLWTQLIGGLESGYGQMPGDGMTIGTTDNDLTVGGTVNFDILNFFPLAVCTMKRTPSVLIIGDSRETGYNAGGVSDAYGDCGAVARIVGPVHGYSNWAVASTTQDQWNAGSHTYLNQLLALGVFTHVINCYGVNDSGNASASAATLVTRRTTCANALKAVNENLMVIGATIYPVCSSSDVFVSKSGQTVGAGGLRILTFNYLCRTIIPGEDACWDQASGLDITNEGKFPVSMDTSLASRTPASGSACTISGTTLTVGGTVTGSFNPGDFLWAASSAVAPSTQIIQQLTGTAGGAGTYEVSKTHSGYPFKSPVSSTTITTAGTIVDDGLHNRLLGQEMIVRNRGAALLNLIAS